MKTTLPLLVLFAAVIGGGIWIASLPTTISPAPAPVVTPTVSTNPATTTPTAPPPKPSGYTLAQVAQHSSQASCWTTINGSVYDLTSFISQHPGGEGAILSICGKDGTAAFEDQHSSNRRANTTLATFKIGALIQ